MPRRRSAATARHCGVAGDRIASLTVAAEPEKLDSYQCDIAKGLEGAFGDAEELGAGPVA